LCRNRAFDAPATTKVESEKGIKETLVTFLHSIEDKYPEDKVFEGLTGGALTNTG